MIHVHMHDQIPNRVELVMADYTAPNWDELFQNITILGILGIFFLYSLPALA